MIKTTPQKTTDHLFSLNMSLHFNNVYLYTVYRPVNTAYPDPNWILCNTIDINISIWKLSYLNWVLPHNLYGMMYMYIQYSLLRHLVDPCPSTVSVSIYRSCHNPCRMSCYVHNAVCTYAAPVGPYQLIVRSFKASRWWKLTTYLAR